MKNEFVLAFNEMLEEKQLPRDIVIKALESAMVSAYRKVVTAPSAQHVEAELDAETGEFRIYVEKEVVEEVVEDRTEVTLDEARKKYPEAQLGDMVIVDNTPSDFGRVAAQTARQVIQQRLRDAERQDQVEFFDKKVGEIVSGIVQSVNSEGFSIGLDRKAEGILSRRNLIPGEDRKITIHSHIRALVTEVRDSARAPQIILSRTDRKFLFRLMEIDVPEIFHGIVEVRSIAREPGARAKVAVSATQQGIDPVGACVGMQGKRIKPIVKELRDEKIDVIEWNPDPAVFIAKALSPARVVGVYLGGDKNATVIVPEDQLSLAIGGNGQNARLAAKLTGWRIDIKSVLETASEFIALYESNEDLVEVNSNNEKIVLVSHSDLIKNEAEHIDEIRAIVAKRTEGYPISMDDTDKLNRFVDRIQKQIVSLYNDSTVDERIAMMEQENMDIETVLALPIAESGLPKHIVSVLKHNNFKTFGELFEQMKKDPEGIFNLHGILPKTMNEIASITKFISGVETRENEPVEVEPMSEIADIEPENKTEEEISTPESIEPATQEPVEIPDLFEDILPTIEVEEPVVEPEETIAEEVDEVSFDKLLEAMKSELTPMDYSDDDDDYGVSTGRKKKGRKGKKKKNTDIEYDPDSKSTIVRKKHRRDDDEDWGW